MTQLVRFLRCTRVHRGVSPHLILLVALVSCAVLSAGLPVGAVEGEIDLSFNGEGFVVTNHDEVDQIDDIVIQPDGKVVAVGHSGFDRGPDGALLDVMVARYNFDGSLDPYFGNGGIVITDIGPSMKDMSVALQPDGKIVVAGGQDANFISTRMVLARFNTDGSLDTTFGFAGTAHESFRRPIRIKDLAILSDGKILLAGEAETKDRRRTFAATLVRFDEFGSLDFTFADGGVSQPLPDGSTAPRMIAANDLALQTDEKIVLAGVCQQESLLKFCLSRYNSDGSIDNTFHGNGLVMAHFNSFFSNGAAKSVGIQRDGKIVAAGEAAIDFSSQGRVPVLARFTTDGFPDSSFGSNGDGTEVSFETPNLRFEALAVKPSGKIVVVGETIVSPFNPTLSRMSTVLYDADGRIQGILTQQIGDRAAATAVAVHPDGRVVVGGAGNLHIDPAFTFSDFALVRYGPNDPPIVSIDGSPSLVAVNTPVHFFGTVIDDSGPPVVEWIFESTSGTTVVSASWDFGSVLTTHAFSEAGVYKVSLKATDDGFLSSIAETLVVVYDPNGGWVAGGGWIDSPAGAFALDPTLSGKANFGFVSKYQTGANAPTGNAQFHFNAGDLRFQSMGYEWLVISGGRKAQYKGFGTINGSGIYHFMLTAIDGDQSGGGGQDRFRIRIWSDSDSLIYDNQLNAPDGEDPTTVLGGGSIVIHH